MPGYSRFTDFASRQALACAALLVTGATVIACAADDTSDGVGAAGASGSAGLPGTGMGGIGAGTGTGGATGGNTSTGGTGGAGGSAGSEAGGTGGSGGSAGSEAGGAMNTGGTAGGGGASGGMGGEGNGGGGGASGGMGGAVALGDAVYVDASSGPSGNTTLADGSLFDPPLDDSGPDNDPPLDGGTGADNDWEERTGFAADGNVFESGAQDIEDAPQLKTTITALVPGSDYRIYVMFWDGSGVDPDWNVRAGLAPDLMGFFANGVESDASDLGATGAEPASSLPYSITPNLFTEEDRTLFAADLGVATADESGEIEVFVDDMPSPIGANNRTWYDGVAVRRLIPPM